MKYIVQVTATACVWQEFEVEADSEGAARGMALMNAAADFRRHGSGAGWEVNGLIGGEDGHGDLDITEVSCEKGAT